MGLKPGKRGLKLAGCVVVVMTLAAVPAASADTLEVTKRADSVPGDCTPGDCSLREAVYAANLNSGSDKIVLPSRRPYRLSRIDILGDGEHDLDITGDPLRIIHPGRGMAVIDADGLDRVFNVFAPTTLRKLVIRGGADASSEGGDGGGIHATADLTLIDSKVTGSDSPDLGGGITTRLEADLVVRNSRISGNTAGVGGGITHLGSAMTIESSKIVGNRAGGSSGDGGAIYFGVGSLDPLSKISDSTISDNRAPNQGGAIYGDGGPLRITGSTFSGNRAGSDGGAILVDGFDLEMVNSTITRNRADTTGGGIAAVDGNVSLNGVTVARNLGNADGILSEAGGGLYDSTSPDLFQLENSLIALNTIGDLGGGGTIPNDCSGDNPFESAGHNLLSTRSLCDGFDAPGDLKRSNPKIGGLADNGGPTKTVALKDGSPAIGKADPDSSPKRDQRGVKRSNPDIGAFERR